MALMRSPSLSPIAVHPSAIVVLGLTPSRMINTVLLLSALFVSVYGGENALPYLSSKEQCTELLGGTDVSVIFTADPGLEYGGIGENYFILQSLQNAKNVTFPACFSAVRGDLFSSKVVLVTTGEGPSTAQLCVFEVLTCSEYIKETMFFGTAGFSPRKGGILNPPSDCTPPVEEGDLVRYGDICITNHAINWDCQGAEWSDTAANWPNECSLAGSPDAPFQDALQDASSASYRGWDCFVNDPDQKSLDLADEMYAAQNYTNKVAPPPEGVQEYLGWYWGNVTQGINRTWTIDTAAAPRVFGRNECAEVDSVYWWTGTPWDTQARGFVSNAVGGAPNTTETVAATAMEGIGYMAALRMAQNITGIAIPYVILRATSDFSIPNPVYQATNGTWLSGQSISLPPSLAATGDGGGAPVTMYAIESGNSLILGLFENRLKSSSSTMTGEVDSSADASQDTASSSAGRHATVNVSDVISFACLHRDGVYIPWFYQVDYCNPLELYFNARNFLAIPLIKVAMDTEVMAVPNTSDSGLESVCVFNTNNHAIWTGSSVRTESPLAKLNHIVLLFNDPPWVNEYH